MRKGIRFLLLLVVVFLSGNGQAQNDTIRKPRVSLYGFVRNYFNYDSRNTYTVLGGEFNMLPYDESWNGTQEQCDALGIDRVDLNAVPQAHLLALTTRVGLKLEGPDILGARSSGKVEADFAGFGSTNYLFRIRLAYINLSWNCHSGAQHQLLMGQDWHPLSGDIMPEVLGMAAGNPFRANSRTPQLRYTFTNGSLGFTAAALYQLQYMYNGPSYTGNGWASVSSLGYANHALIPELFLGVQYRDEKIYTQLGSTCQPLRPRQFAYTTGMVDGTPVTLAKPVDEMLITFTPTIYFQYTDRRFAAKFRAQYAHNTSHVSQLNGYAVVDQVDDGWSYAPLRAAISYLNLSYGKRYRANLFLGYMKNLGADRDLYNFGTVDAPLYYIFMRGEDHFTHLNSVYRIAPSVSYNLAHFNLGIEYEWTGCTFGNLASNGSILLDDQLHQVVNHRVCMMVKYNF